MDHWVEELSPELFWDVDRRSIDAELHLRWLVERVISGGRWADWLLLRNHVTPQGLGELVPRLHLSGRDKCFLEKYLDGCCV